MRGIIERPNGLTTLSLPTQVKVRKPGQWNVEHAEMLEDADISIPAWNGVHPGKFDYLEVSDTTGLTQAYYAIEVKDRQGNPWRTVARCVVRGGEAVVDEFFPPVMTKTAKP